VVEYKLGMAHGIDLITAGYYDEEFFTAQATHCIVRPLIELLITFAARKWLVR
jgi:hypothetical protein